MNIISVIITDHKIYGAYNKSIICESNDINEIRSKMYVYALKFGEVSLNEFKLEDASRENVNYYLQSKP